MGSSRELRLLSLSQFTGLQECAFGLSEAWHMNNAPENPAHVKQLYPKAEGRGVQFAWCLRFSTKYPGPSLIFPTYSISCPHPTPATSLPSLSMEGEGWSPWPPGKTTAVREEVVSSRSLKQSLKCPQHGFDSTSIKTGIRDCTYGWQQVCHVGPSPGS